MEHPLPLPSASATGVVSVARPDLAFEPVPVTDRTPTARQVLATMGLTPHSEYVVLQWLPGGDVEQVGPEELIVMTDGKTPRLIVAKADRTFRLVLDDRSLEWPEGEISEEALRVLGVVGPDQQLYLVREGEADRLLRPGDRIDLRARGVETVYAKSREWKLNVQGVTIESRVPTISVRDAMALAGFDTKARWIIILKTAAGRKQVDLDHVIDLREPGVEKLRLTPREINNGERATEVRREFPLLATDHAWLDERGHDWSTLLDGGRRWLVLRGMPLPAGYNAPNATIAMEIPTAYPMAEVDMFYCYPWLARSDGREIPQTQISQLIGGRSFQRWSRHRGAIAPWRPGQDNIVTHLLLVDESLNREVEK